MQPPLPPSSDHVKVPGECLLYLEGYKVLVCRLCQYALRSNGTALHYQRYHKDLLSTSQRHRFTQFEKSIFEKSMTVADMGDIILNSPRNVVPALLGLKVIQVQECPHCAFIMSTERSMRQHCKVTHGRRQ
jgi:hypothetical protein